MESRPAQTAVGPMVIVAVDQYDDHPLIRDELAHRVLPVGLKAFVTLTRWGPVRRWMVGGMEKKAPGMWAGFLCRKRYIDDQVSEAVAEGAEAVVILGAGLDTRGCRLPDLAQLPVYEVDLPENIARKRVLLHKVFGKVPDHITLVPVDFNTQDLAGVLAKHGYEASARTFFLWEAVTQYLTEDGVRKTFDFLSAACPGSRLVFTHLPEEFLEGQEFHGAESLYREYVVMRRLWHFGLDPHRVPAFLAEYGWRVVEQPDAREFVARYVEPADRNLPVSEVERSVSAKKTWRTLPVPAPPRRQQAGDHSIRDTLSTPRAVSVSMWWVSRSRQAEPGRSVAWLSEVRASDSSWSQSGGLASRSRRSTSARVPYTSFREQCAGRRRPANGARPAGRCGRFGGP